MDIYEHIFFLLALRIRSKLKQDVNISPFVNQFMLKNRRALDTFFACQLNENVYLSQIVNFRNFCSPLSFF